MIDGTMRGVEIRALPRLLAAAAFAALLTAGCSGSVPGEPTPQPPPPVTAPAPSGPARPTAEPSPAAAASCQVTATSTGSISASGSGGSTSTINGRTSFSCGNGPRLGIETVADAGVTFAAPDGTTTTVAPGTAGRVGGYTIDVARVAGGTAEFQVLME
jgi:ABC-type amino acid transport substrate-binding protein